MDTPKTNPATGASTPVVELDAEQAKISLRVSLADLIAKGNAMYAQRNYEEASEMFSRAAEMQDEMNGEMNPDNAELLFLYGRSLFKVGQAKSDVLGGRAPDAADAVPPTPKANKKKPATAKEQTREQKEAEQTGGGAATPAAAPVAEDAPMESSTTAEGGKAESVLAKVAAKNEVPAGAAPDKPLFSFDGDENLVDLDEQEAPDGEEVDAAAEEDEDDLAVAFEILDMARLLYEKQLEAAKAAAAAEPEDKGEPVVDTKGKGKDAAASGGEDASAASAVKDTPTLRHIKERLADTFDLQAEISLENERYPSAITDFRKALDYKRELFPNDREIMSEAYFKLSLALEFASVTATGDGEEAEDQGNTTSTTTKTIDEALRSEAAEQLEAAIEVLRTGLQAKEVELATLHSPEDNEATRGRIAESRELIADMEQRLADLRAAPVDLREELGLKELLGGSSSLQGGGAAAAEEAARNATDLTGLVRKKRKAEADPELADGAESGDGVVGAATKKAKGSDD